MELIMQLVLGAVGGNGAGALLKKFDLGVLGNSLAGIAGGGIGGQLLDGAIDNGAISTIAGGAAGGGILMMIVGVIKNALAQ